LFAKGKAFKVDTVETLNMSRNKVIVAITAKYRDNHPVTYLAENPFKYGAPLRVLQDEQEFWEDVKNQIDYLNSTLSNPNPLDDHMHACLYAIHKHIEKYNRLIDSDMEMLVDCTMHILDACGINDGFDMMTLRKAIIKTIEDSYGAYIYFARHPAFGEPELVKLVQ
jgi:hypothetical protein